jgi:hypothetical protein
MIRNNTVTQQARVTPAAKRTPNALLSETRENELY